jgi:hypothetical protein
MFATDATMLASFGTAKIWPAYLMYGNESKYRRGKAPLGLFEEFAYFQSVSTVIVSRGSVLMSLCSSRMISRIGIFPPLVKIM